MHATPAPVTAADIRAVFGPKKIKLRTPKRPAYRAEEGGQGVLGLDLDFTDRWCAVMEELIGERPFDTVSAPEWALLADAAEVTARAA